jgi:dynein heavy chain, axonemal
MNLGSMAASRHVRPFLDDVRRWEARLGGVAETIAAWMSAQRKWIYLESIFAGSDDIRQQLPQVRLPVLVL